MEIQENVPLSDLTTFQTGGPVRFLITINTPEELASAAAFAKDKSLPVVPLGSGSNMLAPDQRLEAVFVRLLSSRISVSESADAYLYRGEAGASWDALAAEAVERGAWGIENLSGIPGTIGAAVVQNIGAYGAALSDTLSEVQAFDLKEGKSVTFKNDACAFGYRTSIFKQHRDRYFITGVALSLSKIPRRNLSYRDLKNRFENESAASLADIRAAVLEIRSGKFPPLSEFGTAGSFFLNPIVGESEVSALRARYPEMPFFALPEGGVKVPLAWLFDHVLNLKGMRVGKAFVWEKQPLVIAAEKGAISAEVEALAEKIAQMLRETTGIAIIPEVRVFGSDKKNILRA